MRSPSLHVYSYRPFSGERKSATSTPGSETAAMRHVLPRVYGVSAESLLRRPVWETRAEDADPLGGRLQIRNGTPRAHDPRMGTAPKPSPTSIGSVHPLTLQHHHHEIQPPRSQRPRLGAARRAKPFHALSTLTHLSHNPLTPRQQRRSPRTQPQPHPDLTTNLTGRPRILSNSSTTVTDHPASDPPADMRTTTNLIC